MNALRRIASLIIWLGLGAFLMAHQGIAGLGLFIIFSAVFLLVEYLCRVIIRRRLRIPRSLVISLLATVMFLVFLLFTTAFVEGVDAVEVIPSWIKYIVVMYFCAVIQFALRFSEDPLNKHGPAQPPPKAGSI